MSKRLRGKHCGEESGFTLLELLVVLVIISIVVSLALVGWRHQRIKAVNATLLSDVRSAATYVKAEYMENLTFSSALPSSFDKPSKNNQLAMTTEGTCLEGTNEEYEQLFWRYSLIDNLITSTPCPPPNEGDVIEPGEPEEPDDEEEDPIASPPEDGIPNPGRVEVDPAFYTGNQSAGASQLRLLSSRGDMKVGGNFSCDSQVSIEGSVVSEGDAYLTNNCVIHGDLWVKGSLSMDSQAQILGTAQVQGDASFQSTNHIGGGIWVKGDFNSIDGRTNQQLLDQERIKVGIFTGYDKIEPYSSPPFPAYKAENITTSWSDWLKQQASLYSTPDWSPISQGSGCTVSPGQSWSLPGDIVINENTVVDARDCPTAEIGSGGTIQLYADFTMYVNNFATPNGIKVVSGDGQPHDFNIITPIQGDTPTPSCSEHNTRISIGNNSSFDKQVTTTLYSEGRVQIEGGTSLTGGIWGGCTGHMGLVTITPK